MTSGDEGLHFKAMRQFESLVTPQSRMERREAPMEPLSLTIALCERLTPNHSVATSGATEYEPHLSLWRCFSDFQGLGGYRIP